MERDIRMRVSLRSRIAQYGRPGFRDAGELCGHESCWKALQAEKLLGKLCLCKRLEGENNRYGIAAAKSGKSHQLRGKTLPRQGRGYLTRREPAVLSTIDAIVLATLLRLRCQHALQVRIYLKKHVTT